jgi:hypothetical protein
MTTIWMEFRYVELPQLADQRQISFSKPAIQRDKRGTVGIRQVTTLCGPTRPSASEQTNALRSSWRSAKVDFRRLGFREEASTEAAHGPSDSRFRQTKRAHARSLRTAAARMREASRSLGQHWDAARADSRVLHQRLQ